MKELAQGFKDDPDLFHFWCDRALKDPFNRGSDWQDNPRQTALNILLKQYPKQAKTVEVLQECAQNDSDNKIRKWAAEQLIKLQSEV